MKQLKLKISIVLLLIFAIVLISIIVLKINKLKYEKSIEGMKITLIAGTNI